MSGGVGGEALTAGDRHVTPALSRRVPAGLLDSALSSLATFLTGFLAVHYLTPALLGAYSLALTAFLLAGALTSDLMFTGVETFVVRELRPGERAGVITRSLPKGFCVALSFAVAAGAATVLVPSGAGLSARLALASSCVVVSTVSPLQDHVRRMLHIALDAWGAAVVSLAQFATAALGAAVVIWAGLGSKAWTPFCVLAVANVVSLGVGLFRVRGPQPLAVGTIDVGLRRSLSFGKTLAVAAGFNFGSNFIATAVVIGRAGFTAAGTAEAARVLAQPLTLVSVGLLTVLGPDLMRTAARAEVRRLRKLIAIFLGVMVVISLVWALIAWRPWSWSPLPDLSATAYVLPGLVLLTVPAQVLGYLGGFATVVSQAVGHIRKIAVIQVVTSVIGLGVVLLTARHGAWALPLGTLASGGLLLGAGVFLTFGPRRFSLVP